MYIIWFYESIFHIELSRSLVARVVNNDTRPLPPQYDRWEGWQGGPVCGYGAGGHVTRPVHLTCSDLVTPTPSLPHSPCDGSRDTGDGSVVGRAPPSRTKRASGPNWGDGVGDWTANTKQPGRGGSAVPIDRRVHPVPQWAVIPLMEVAQRWFRRQLLGTLPTLKSGRVPVTPSLTPTPPLTGGQIDGWLARGSAGHRDAGSHPMIGPRPAPTTLLLIYRSDMVVSISKLQFIINSLSREARWLCLASMVSAERIE